MNKKLLAVLIVAVLVLACASARVVNFAIGPSFGFFTGDAPTSEDAETTTPYKGTGFGFDATFSLTLGDRAEIYFQEVFNFTGSSVFTELADAEPEMSMNYKSYVGYEHAIVTDPVKFSVGAGFVLEVISSDYRVELLDLDVMPICLNLGIGATAKVEFPLGKHFSLYLKGNLDYFPIASFTIGTEPANEDVEQKAYAGAVSNLSLGASAGIVLYF